MNKQGYLIGRSGSTPEYFTSASAYDRPQWVSLTEATVFPTPELAQVAAKKLWQYGAYSANLISVTEALDALPPEEDELDPALDGLPPEDIETLSEPGGDAEAGYGADGELDGEAIPAMDGEEDLDAELDGEEGGSFEFEMPPEENDENAISDIELKMMKRPTTEGVDHNGDRVFQTYAAWKRAVKAINPSAEFYGDKDIGGAKGIGEWDGETGLVFAKALRDKWASEKTNESILHELSKTTLKSYLKKAVGSTKELVEKGDMVKGVDRAKKTVWASGKLKDKMKSGVTESVEAKKMEFKDPSVECNKGTNEYTNKPGGDKVAVPASIKSSLSTVIAKFKKTADAEDGRNGVSASQDLTVADALQQLLDDLSAGTLEGMKQAQIHMTSYMTPILQHIPADVTKFIAKGGKQESLSSMFASIKESSRKSFEDMSDEYHKTK